MTTRDGSQTCDGCTREQQSGGPATRSGQHIGTRTGTSGATIPADAYRSDR